MLAACSTELLGLLVCALVFLVWAMVYTPTEGHHQRQNVAAVGLGMLDVAIVVATCIAVLTATIGATALTRAVAK